MALILGCPAIAGDLTVSVRDAAGRPVQDAVVTVHPATGAPVAAVGCNIHDQRLASIKVEDTPCSARTSAGGDMTLRAIPAGAATVRVWHARLSGRGNEIAQAVTLTAASGQRTVRGDFSARAAVR